MLNNLPILIIIIPLLTALLSFILFKANRYLGAYTVISSMGLTLVFSIIQLKHVIENGPITYFIGNIKASYGIEFMIQTVNGSLIVLVCLIGFLTMLYCINLEKARTKFEMASFYSLLTLLIVGMLGMLSTADIFNLYVFLEITSISAYVLIAVGGNKGTVAAFRYLIIGTVGGSLYLLGVGFLYANTGSLNMVDIANVLSVGNHNQTIFVSVILFLVGFGIKMAIFPLHGWQPSAYAEAHRGAIPLIAGTMSKIPAFAMFRFFFYIFAPSFDYMKVLLLVMGILSSASMLYGSFRAIAQKDFKKVLAYSSVAQIGYVSLGFAIGNPMALAGGILHIFNHAFMKSGLFFGIGAISYRYGDTSIEKLGQIYKKMPITSVLIVTAALSMIGIPITGGFFSKWYIGLGAAQAGMYAYIGVLVLSSLLNSIYFFRIIENIFMNKDVELEDLHPELKRELGITMLIPIFATFIAIIAMGVFNSYIVDILEMTLREVAIW